MLIRLIAVLILAVSAPFAASSEAWKDYTLRNVAFSVPAHWYQTMDMRDEELDFVSPDERFKLWARWWFPDEPLLGYSDIVSHEELTLAGQQALFIHSELQGERVLELAFLKPDARGEQFLFQLIAQGVPLAEHRAMLDQLVARLKLDGIPARPGQNPARNTDPNTHREPVAAPSPIRPQPPSEQPTVKGADKKPSTSTATAIPQLAPLPQQAPRPSQPDPQANTETRAVARWQTVLSREMGETCKTAVSTRQIERMQNVLKEAGAELQFVLSCQNGHLPVFAVKFPYDQRGPTEDYFYPLFDRMLLRNGGRPLAFLEVRDNLLTRVSLLESGDIEVALDQLPHQDSALAPSPSAPAVQPNRQPAVTSTPARKTRKADPAGLPRPRQQLPRPQQDRAEAQDQGPVVLFDGTSLQQLEGFAHSSADFAAWSRLRENVLLLTIPDGDTWAHIGVQTKRPVVTFPRRGSRQSTRISFTIDADETNTFVAALTPAGKAEADPWEGFDLYLSMLRLDDGSTYAVFRQRDVLTVPEIRFPWPQGETTFELILHPEQVVELRRKNGGRLAWIEVERDFTTQDWLIQTFLAESRHTQNTRLTLTGITLDQFEAPPLPAIDLLTKGPRAVTVFDGTAMQPVWAKLSSPRSAAQRFTSLQEGTLQLSWPQGEEVDALGIYSNEPVLWLDHFGPRAIAHVNVSLKGAQSGDFSIGFHSRKGLPDSPLGSDGCSLHVTRQDTDYQVLLSGSEGRDSDVFLGTLEVLPDEFTFVLTPRGISALMEGTSAQPTTCRWLKDGIGLRLWAYATGRADGQTGLALNQIQVEYTPDIMVETETANSEVPPLPITTLFSGQISPEWSPRDQGYALFTDLSEQTRDGLTLSRRDAPPPAIALVWSATRLSSRLTTVLVTPPLRPGSTFAPMIRT